MHLLKSFKISRVLNIDEALQLSLWNEISAFKSPNDEAWLLMGDFNIVENLNEKLGGVLFITNYMVNFGNFLNNNNLCSLPTSGVPFTWTNNHKDHTVVYEKLDRACANPNWVIQFPEVEVENLPIVGSDHGPVCVSLNHKSPKRASPFKFEAIWMTHSSFKSLVRNIWQPMHDTNPQRNFTTL